MPKYYAYIPNEDGKEPCGTANRCLFELNAVRNPQREAFNRLGTYNYILIRYTNLYDENTYTIIKGNHIKD